MIWRLEVVNSLVVAERRRLIEPGKAARFLDDLQKFRITVDLEGLDRIFDDVLERARYYQRSAYDASYLELAQRRRLPLATKDEPLRMAAAHMGLALFQP